ncbi:MAG: NADH-quinone oxidoreductase subunit K [Methylotenera sp.]|nr:NADH-quinone oxidoreductase subunit K [Methylotenera sp.]MDO9234299.1 NADH-quinone oxidoreductase subunit K [Methylotenera sp.]MDO9388915.1 NADH-quinone oxidoreductase subunit K [Methylotenera sp.]MDP2101186.1 NADH-quinone oxidoreductase subunit K [Methylotenera sp.]MDP2280970.1 NADH-quinone oxidoreductase subunit K [Methylotenera sp.]
MTTLHSITPALLYALGGAMLFVLGLSGIILLDQPLRKILAFNLMGSGAFLVLVGLAQRTGITDPVPQAMVLTGIVVAVAATALALAVMNRLQQLQESEPPPQHKDAHD